MTGYDVIKRARRLLGYSGTDLSGVGSELAVTQGLEIINQLAVDLRCDGLSSVGEELNIPEAKEEALCYGVAMFMALTEGDAAKNQIFAQIYNAKRSAALAETASVKDLLPEVTVG